MNPRPEHFNALAHAIRTCSSPSRRRDLEEIRSFLSTVSADLSDIDDGEPDDNDDNDIASLKAHIAELEARCKAQHEVMTDMVAERNALKDELERERIRLAACGVVAISNTRETAKENREVSNEYKSSSFDQVCAAVDREMALRERIEELESHPPASDLRERLLESALRGVNVSGLHRSEAELIGKASVWMVDAAIDAMRKGEPHGK